MKCHSFPHVLVVAVVAVVAAVVVGVVVFMYGCSFSLSYI